MLPVTSIPPADSSALKQMSVMRPQRPASLVSGTRRAGPLSAMFTQHLDAMVNNCAGAKFSDDPEFVHQAQVSIRRLRTGLKFFHALRQNGIDRLCADTDDELKWLFRLLGHARDWDVFMAGELRLMAISYHDPVQATALLEEAHRQRRQAYDQLREGLNGPRYARLLRKIQREIGDWRLLHENTAQNLGTMAVHELRRAHKRLISNTQHLQNASQRQWQQLRITIKKLRYATDVLVPFFSRKRARDYLRNLDRAQDCLGQMNDLFQAARLLRALTPTAEFREFALARLAAGLLLAQEPAKRHLTQLGNAAKPWKDLQTH